MGERHHAAVRVPPAEPSERQDMVADRTVERPRGEILVAFFGVTVAQFLTRIMSDLGRKRTGC